VNAQSGAVERRVVIAEEGYDVVAQAGDGERAVELAEELRPDLVILDVTMPELDGITAAQ